MKQDDMKKQILSNLDNPVQLEKLYRADKQAFKREFSAVATDLQDNPLVRFWNARLHFVKDEISRSTRSDLVFAILASVLAGLIAKLPDLLGIDKEFFYTRNVGFIVFPALAAFFIWKNKLSFGKIAVVFGAILAGLVFINTLPDNRQSDTLALACGHLLLLLWSVLGFSFVGNDTHDIDRRLGYLRYNGDLIVMTTIILIAGGILSGITIGLFSVIGLNIEEFYFENVVVVGLPAAPIIGTYLTQTNPQLVGKVSPVIARLFSPLVLVMLVIYLVAMAYSGKDPYTDREFLIIFNALLVGVMAIIFFSIAESRRVTNHRAEVWVLALLSAVTVVVNVVALSAIIFRISTWGITPNRAAVLGGNVLILINLSWVTMQLFRALADKGSTAGVGRSIALFLPVYIVWAVIVTFLFPLVFGFR